MNGIYCGWFVREGSLKLISKEKNTEWIIFPSFVPNHVALERYYKLEQVIGLPYISQRISDFKIHDVIDIF